MADPEAPGPSASVDGSSTVSSRGRIASWRAAGLAVAGIYAAVALGTSQLQVDYQAATAAGRDYWQTRAAGAFEDNPLEKAGDVLDLWLPLDQDLVIDSAFAGNALWDQRSAEALYPRHVRTAAPYRLAILPELTGRLVPFRNTGVVLQNFPAKPLAAKVARASNERSFPVFVYLFLALLGWGWAAERSLRRWAPGAVRTVPMPWPETVVRGFGAKALYGVVVLAAAVYLATFVQVALPWRLFSATGVGLAIAGAARFAVARRWRRWLTPRTGLLTALTVAVLAALTVLAVRFVDGSPVTSWDGHSVWLLHAHEVHFAGRLALRDLFWTETAWTHQEYPLFWPSILAFFSDAGPWRERQALLGTAMLFMGCYSLLWLGFVPRLGRLGAAFACAAFFVTLYPLQLAAYADTWLTLFALIGLLGLFEEGLPISVGCAALMAAALTKKEGAVLAAGALMLWGAGQLLTRRRSWRFVLTAFGCVLALTVGHRLWMTAHGFAPHTDVGAGLTWGVIWGRINATYALTRTSVATQPLWLLGLGGVLAASSWCVSTRTLGTPGVLTLFFLGWMAFVLATFAFTPYPFEWHISTALTRVAFHAFAVAALAPLLMIPRSPPPAR
ncbi:MAG TPA: hypothetical protein VGP07_04440 [Polyangia bacterium]|jgi:hypothetical protein